ncbi:prepilin peptidase [Pantoea sp. FN060301]|uniref:prepilin peptidase n=1 Tax=Pantoea sp. FN060301 TaxID=3420380 RepID=UPI003D1825AA
MSVTGEMWQRFPEVWFSGLALLGACMGSFLNVVICRLPLALSAEPAAASLIFRLLYPASHCTSCHARIRWYDNLPLISWGLLKGRCRCCGRSVSRQYPLVEALSLSLTLLAGLLYSPGPHLAGLLIFSWLLLALSAIDLNTLLLPDSLTLTLLWSGLLFNLNGLFSSLSDAVIGAVIGYVTLRLLCTLGEGIFRKPCLGYGDCKMVAGLAAWTGWQSLPKLLLLASALGLAGLTVAWLRGKKTFASPVPFGPALAAAGWLMLVSATH